MKPQSPCLDCEKRVIGCHDKCELYRKYRDRIDKWSEKVNNNKGEFVYGNRYYKHRCSR